MVMRHSAKVEQEVSADLAKVLEGSVVLVDLKIFLKKCFRGPRVLHEVRLNRKRAKMSDMI